MMYSHGALRITYIECQNHIPTNHTLFFLQLTMRVPHFGSKMVLDPDFGVLLTDPNDPDTQLQSDASKQSKKTVSIAIIVR